MKSVKHGKLLHIIQLIIKVQHVFLLTCRTATTRRNFIAKGNKISSIVGVSTAFLAQPQHERVAIASQTLQTDKSFNVYNDITDLFDEKYIPWSNKTELWSKSRYRSSTLSANSENFPPNLYSPLYYPDWMEGYWSMSYKFIKASFSQGRNILSLRTPGAGLGTCMSLPNVGYSPPIFAAHFLKNEKFNKADFDVYEDLAYNIPRKFEAFWPQSKVLSVQTNGYVTKDSQDTITSLLPKCFVTGEGCTKEENKDLHLPASRLAIDFDGPTRRSGRLTQSSDLSLVHNICGLSMNKNSYAASKDYSQFNVNQDLQTFFREIISFEKINQDTILGKVRVAAYLPKYIKALDAKNDNDEYNENIAVAIYDYKVLMKRIDENEATSF